ncbi:M67 family metallopeptidase [Sphingomonas nostoxanthinifaciens]|uniref:M67 family metallopeptidase n=1 Tax=Sphingomonas nostoxanthinifaciens TaxID=2872652 RepID=UPI0037DA305E
MIAADLLDAILAHAAADPTREVCGLLLGSAGQIEEARATANVAADPSCWFEVDPSALIAALRAERRGGPCLIGHYHSHPNGRPEPSPRDAAAAEPGRLWLIVGGGVARLWCAGADGFREGPLTVG